MARRVRRQTGRARTSAALFPRRAPAAPPLLSRSALRSALDAGLGRDRLVVPVALAAAAVWLVGRALLDHARRVFDPLPATSAVVVLALFFSLIAGLWLPRGLFVMLARRWPAHWPGGGLLAAADTQRERQILRWLVAGLMLAIGGFSALLARALYPLHEYAYEALLQRFFWTPVTLRVAETLSILALCILPGSQIALGLYALAIVDAYADPARLRWRRCAHAILAGVACAVIVDFLLLPDGSSLAGSALAAMACFAAAFFCTRGAERCHQSPPPSSAPARGARRASPPTRSTASLLALAVLLWATAASAWTTSLLWGSAPLRSPAARSLLLLAALGALGCGLAWPARWIRPWRLAAAGSPLVIFGALLALASHLPPAHVPLSAVWIALPTAVMLTGAAVLAGSSGATLVTAWLERVPGVGAGRLSFATITLAGGAAGALATAAFISANALHVGLALLSLALVGCGGLLVIFEPALTGWPYRVRVTGVFAVLLGLLAFLPVGTARPGATQAALRGRADRERLLRAGWTARALQAPLRGRRAALIDLDPGPLAFWRHRGFRQIDLWSWSPPPGPPVPGASAATPVRLEYHGEPAALGLRLAPGAYDLIAVRLPAADPTFPLRTLLARIRDHLVPGGQCVLLVPARHVPAPPAEVTAAPIIAHLPDELRTRAAELMIADHLCIVTRRAHARSDGRARPETRTARLGP